MNHYAPRKKPTQIEMFIDVIKETWMLFLVLFMVLGLLLWNLALQNQVRELSREEVEIMQTYEPQCHIGVQQN